jgi:hypothetical protein
MSPFRSIRLAQLLYYIDNNIRFTEYVITTLLGVVSTSFGDLPTFSIRGLGFTSNQIAAVPTVSVYVDEAPLPRILLRALPDMMRPRYENLWRKTRSASCQMHDAD